MLHGLVLQIPVIFEKHLVCTCVLYSGICAASLSVTFNKKACFLKNQNFSPLEYMVF